MPNPFYDGEIVTPDRDVGQRAELQRIFAALDQSHITQLQSISVVGPRQIEHDFALRRIVNALARDDTEFSKQYYDNESFRKWLNDRVFAMTYESARN